VTLDVHALDLDDPGDVALGRALIEEYVEFTADEAQEHGLYEIDRTTLQRVIPDLHDFGGRYRGGAYLVGTRDGVVAGGVGITRGADHTCEMNRLWLRAAHRGSGTGRRLAEASLAHAEALGFTRMVLDVAPYRAGAIALYESMGFRKTDPLHEYPFEMLAYARDLRKGGR
jgi:ribosomal protein S18 acetylase RimI-like enzyme